MIKRYNEFLKTNEEFQSMDDAANLEFEETKKEVDSEEEDDNYDPEGDEDYGTMSADGSDGLGYPEEVEEEGGNDLHSLLNAINKVKNESAADEAVLVGNEIEYKGLTISKPSETETFHVAVDNHFIDLNTADVEVAKKYIDDYVSGKIKAEDLKAIKRKAQSQAQAQRKAQAQNEASRFKSYKK